ncbi:MAG: ATP-binding protein [Pseudobutyrivibrio sp.]|nr:ATP-binding protein [Pseudobutyrivibrio sp.]
MEREALNTLLRWKDNNKKKPLILKGARQVGKTWIMKEFGNRYYSKVAYISFYNNARMRAVFEEDYNIDRILMNIAAETGVKVTPGDTLIIFDEIQEAPKALESLKYFCEDAPEYDVVAAGSLLGVAIHAGISYPVGKVEELSIYPMSFEEFLLAVGEDILVENLINRRYEWLKDLKDKYLFWLKNYFFVGGMPEVVQYFVDEKDYVGVRKLQKSLLANYEKDFGKHAEGELRLRVSQVWNAIPMQLSKENKKFFFGGIKKGARMKDFELAIQWLTDCGLVHKVTRVSKPGLPLKSYEEIEAFKLFILDVGLASAMCNLGSRVLLEGDSTFTEFKGALTENYVLQQLKSNTEYQIYYYSRDTSDFELDFLLDGDEGAIPVEVKAQENLRAKSFKNYCDEFRPVTAYRTSQSDYRTESWMTNIPLYAIGTI